METYRIYAKFNGQKQFKPVDWSSGQQVTNLIYATLIPSENLERAKTAIASAAKLNSGLKLELRDIKGNKVFKAY